MVCDPSPPTCERVTKNLALLVYACSMVFLTGFSTLFNDDNNVTVHLYILFVGLCPEIPIVHEGVHGYDL